MVAQDYNELKNVKKYDGTFNFFDRVGLFYGKNEAGIANAGLNYRELVISLDEAKALDTAFKVNKF